MPQSLESLLRRKAREKTQAHRRPKDEEHQHQAALVEWARLVRAPGVEGFIADYLFAIPNAGKRSPVAAARLAAEGLKKGVWDLMLALPFGGRPGLWIEMKSKTGSLEPEQREWGQRMTAVGYVTVVCRSCDAAREAVLQYLGMK